jgi:hypothetical protein
MMKKYVLFLAVALTLSGNVNAGPVTEKVNQDLFEDFLNEKASAYPILKKLRLEPLFKKTTRKLLEDDLSIDFQKLLNTGIQSHIKTYIDCMGLIRWTKENDEYIGINFFELVEGLDPVFRDLNPTCGTSGNRRPVKGIFGRS